MKSFENSYEAQSNMEELKLGRFSLTDAERKKIAQDAEAKGENPEAAVLKEEERMRQATARLRKEQTEKAVRDLERYMNSKSRREKK